MTNPVSQSSIFESLKNSNNNGVIESVTYVENLPPLPAKPTTNTEVLVEESALHGRQLTIAQRLENQVSEKYVEPLAESEGYLRFTIDFDFVPLPSASSNKPDDIATMMEQNAKQQNEDPIVEVIRVDNLIEYNTESEKFKTVASTLQPNSDLICDAKLENCVHFWVLDKGMKVLEPIPAKELSVSELLTLYNGKSPFSGRPVVDIEYDSKNTCNIMGKSFSRDTMSKFITGSETLHFDELCKQMTDYIKGIVQSLWQTFQTLQSTTPQQLSREVLVLVGDVLGLNVRHIGKEEGFALVLNKLRSLNGDQFDPVLAKVADENQRKLLASAHEELNKYRQWLDMFKQDLLGLSLMLNLSLCSDPTKNPDSLPQCNLFKNQNSLTTQLMDQSKQKKLIQLLK